MAEKLDLKAVAEKFKYRAPEEMPVKPLEIDWRSVSSRVEDLLERVFLETLVPKAHAPYIVDEVVESTVGPLSLKVTLTSQGTEGINLGMNLMGFDKEPFELAYFLFQEVREASWRNTHREVDPRFRRQGIARRFLNFAEACAVTKGFQEGRPHQISAEPYQLDVVNLFLGEGYEPEDPERLERIRQGDKSLRMEDYTTPQNSMADPRPWVVLEGSELFRVRLVKMFGR